METMENKIEKPWWSFGCIGLMTPTDIRNLGRFNLLILIWALAWSGALLALAADGLVPASLRVLTAATPVALALGAIGAYLHFLRHADELLRKIHLEGLAIGFGFGFLLATSWSMLRGIGAPPLQPAMIGAAMLVGWSIGQARGRRRYA